MNLQVYSDLHFEFHKDHGKSFVKSVDSTGVDLLVLAGDIYPWSRDPERETLAALCARFPKVLYIAGNHEFYGFDTEARHRYRADLLKDIRNLYMPDCNAVTINGQRFVAGTLWFTPQPPDYLPGGGWGSDFRLIHPMPQFAEEQNLRARDFLAREVRSGDVVVTHHLPSEESCDVRFAGSPNNRYFFCDQTPLIVLRGPRLWIHGHTHAHNDYHIASTRVYSNPLGYPGETSHFRDRDLIQV